MATEEILMAAVQAGGDRQELHETIRRHSQAAAEQVKQHGRANDLLTRLRSDPGFAKVPLDDVLDGARFVGRAPEQVEQFMRAVVEPVRRRYETTLGAAAELKV
jgi:adenylosuccinate lyase